MNKGKYIQKVIGAVLEPEGYQFKSFSGQSTWIYYKDLVNDAGENVQLQVIIKHQRFAPVLDILLYSTAFRQPRRTMSKFVPNCKNEGMICETDEDFKKAINAYSQIIDRYALIELEKIKEPITADRFTISQEKYFWDKFKDIRNNFKLKYQIEENISEDEAVSTIYKLLRDIKNKDYSSVQSELIEFASFHTELYEKRYEHAWEWSDELNCSMLTVYEHSSGSYNRKRSFFPLRRMQDCWEETDDQRCKDLLGYLLQGRPFQ